MRKHLEHDGPSDLERLISRYLDHEASPAQAAELRARMRRDPASDALFCEYDEMDRELRVAMRHAMGRPFVVSRRRPVLLRLVRGLAVGLAASVALLLWTRSANRPVVPGGDRPSQAASWFAPLPATSDSYVQPRPVLQRPGIRVHVDDSQRRWIAVPGARPGEYFIIEANRVRTQIVPTHGDF